MDMKKTIVAWLVNASVAAFAVGALQISFAEAAGKEIFALGFSIVSFAMALYLSRGK